MQNGTDLLYHHAKYGEDCGSRAGCRRKSVIFLSVMLWNYKVCDNGNAMKQCCFQNNYGVIACRKVCICAPIFTFFVDPLNEYLRGKFIPKKYHFLRFWGL